MVVFIDDHDTMSDFQSNLDDVLDSLQKHVLNDLTWAEEVELVRQTHHAVQFKAKLKHADAILRDVDVLPAFDLLEPGEDLDDIYMEMKKENDKSRGYYSVSFAERQTEFVADVPSDVKDLIRLLKYWKKTEDLPVKSYFLELLVIFLWRERWGEPDNITVCTSFRKVIIKLKFLHQMKIVWPNLYTYSEYARLPEKPVLLDPMNPFMNVAPAPGDVATVKEKAIGLLKRMPRE